MRTATEIAKQAKRLEQEAYRLRLLEMARSDPIALLAVHWHRTPEEATLAREAVLLTLGDWDPVELASYCSETMNDQSRKRQGVGVQVFAE